MVEAMVEALLVQKHVMVALFMDLAILDDQDLVSLLDGGQAVGNHKGGSPFHEF